MENPDQAFREYLLRTLLKAWEEEECASAETATGTSACTEGLDPELVKQWIGFLELAAESQERWPDEFKDRYEAVLTSLRREFESESGGDGQGKEQT